MIGHYLLALTTEQEDRVLTMKLGCAPSYIRADGCRCIRGAADNMGLGGSANRPRNLYLWRQYDFTVSSVASRWDRLCERFGDTRIATAARNRILSNRARRVLQNRPMQLETVTR